MKFITTLAATAALALPAVSFAQDAPQESQAVTAEATAITDEELSQFVTIGLKGQALQNDESMSDQEKQMTMLSTISESDLGLERFSAIGQAISADEALQQRVQAEVMSQMGALANEDGD